MALVKKDDFDCVEIGAMPADDEGLVLIKQTRIQLAYAKMLFDTGAVSRSKFQTPHQVFVGIQGLISLGLNPIMALRSCGFANGNFTIWGDLPMALVRRSGKLKGVREFLYVMEEKKGPDGVLREVLVEQSFENNNLHKPVRGAVCELIRNDEDTTTRVSFDIEDAKRAGLWNKTPVWRSYPQIMLMRRARAAAINTLFGEVTNGVAQGEYDVVGVPETKADMKHRYAMQTQQLKELATRYQQQQLPEAQAMNNITVKDPFAGITSKDLRDVIKTPEALAEYERRLNKYEKEHGSAPQYRLSSSTGDARNLSNVLSDKKLAEQYEKAAAPEDEVRDNVDIHDDLFEEENEKEQEEAAYKLHEALSVGINQRP